MDIKYSHGWIYYFNNPNFASDKVGKWILYFKNLDFIHDICTKIIEEGIALEVKHLNQQSGVYCIYCEYDDAEAHKRIIDFLLKNNLISKTKSGRLYNISFKTDKQTFMHMYNNDFRPIIVLSDFIDLQTGEWK